MGNIKTLKELSDLTVKQKDWRPFNFASNSDPAGTAFAAQQLVIDQNYKIPDSVNKLRVTRVYCFVLIRLVATQVAITKDQYFARLILRPLNTLTIDSFSDVTVDAPNTMYMNRLIFTENPGQVDYVLNCDGKTPGADAIRLSTIMDLSLAFAGIEAFVTTEISGFYY